jgi:pyruvate dehydrogenase E1 component alpha subunit
MSASLSSVSSSFEPVSQESLLALYKDMLLIRRFEERSGQLYGMGLIAGFCHLYIGQEAVVVGLQACLGPKDSVITAYRDHGHMLACGMDPKGVMAELTGRSGGYSRGKGGSMHMFSREKRFYGGHGIVGAQIPLGTGLAFAHKYLEDGGLCVAYMGDGAANQGQVYEAFNMAALWKLPVLYVVENNGYGMGTSTKRHAAHPEFFKRGEPWGIPGFQVDGMDVIAVREAGQRAVAHIRLGQGPVLLEMNTYRYRGHSMSDPARYRTKEEVEAMKAERDPLVQAKALLMKSYGLEETVFQELEKEIKATCLEAAEFAQSSSLPEACELYTDILVDN